MTKYIKPLFIYISTHLLTNQIAAQPTYLYIQTIEVVDVNQKKLSLEGQQRIKKIAQIPDKITSAYLEKLPQKATYLLFLQGYVADLTYTQSQTHHLKIKIRILKRLDKIRYVQFKGIKKSEKKALLALIPFKKDHFLLPHHKHEALTAIENHFKYQGFPHVHVLLKQAHSKKHQTVLRFEIEKNKKIYIDKVTFVGNHHLAKLKLATQLIYAQERIKNFTHLFQKLFTWSIGTQGLSHLIRFMQGTPLVEAYLMHDIAALKQCYHTKGFVEVAIDYHVTYTKKNKANVTFLIKEGTPYQFGGHITWQGNHIYSEHELNKWIGLKKGQVLNWVKLQNKIYGKAHSKSIQSLYEKKNYTLTAIDIQMHKVGTKAINLIIKLKAQPQPIIHKIVIHQDIPLSFNVANILRQNGLKKGAAIAELKLKNARAILAKTGLFLPESINFYREKISDKKENLICSLEVNYKKKGSTILGFQNWDGVLGVRLKNIDLKKFLQGKKLWVGSQKLSLQINQNLTKLIKFWEINELFSDRKSKFILSFEDLLSSLSIPIKVGADAWVINNAKDEAHEFKKGSSLHMGAMWSNESGMHTLEGLLSAESTQVGNLKISSREIIASGNLKQLMAQATYTFHNLNNPLYPTQGNKLHIQANLFHYLSAHPLLKATYPYLKSTYSKYFELGPIPHLKQTITLKCETSAGLTNLNTSSPIGKFFLGELNRETHLYSSLASDYIRLRGYKNEDIPVNNLSNRIYRGGAYFLMQSGEIRYPLKKSKEAYLLLFIDGACTADALTQPDLAYALSMGLGFRIQTPLGMLGFNFGWPLVHKKNWLPSPDFRLELAW